MKLKFVGKRPLILLPVLGEWKPGDVREFDDDNYAELFLHTSNLGRKAPLLERVVEKPEKKAEIELVAENKEDSKEKK